jgi:IS1 family transposase
LGFVQKKEGNRYNHEQGVQEIGDAWCFVAFERNTKMVLAWELGKRDMTNTMRFLRNLYFAASPEQRFQLSTDGFPAYPTAVARTLGDRVDYAQLIKVYSTPQESERRYSPPEVVDAVRKPIYGYPDEERICTSHVERQNLTMRMQIRRLTRLTNAFSKKWENLRAALALHFAWYNFCKTHGTIKATPAMAAGITDRAWSIGELLNAV